MNPVLPSLALAALLASAPAAQAGEPSGRPLTVIVKGLRNDQGVVRVLLFRGPDGFPSKPAKAFATLSAPIVGGEATVVFDGVPPEAVAVGVWHDENDDGKLQRNFIGIPLEGYGTSNDARSMIGPPDYDDARFDMPAAAHSITLTMAYF